MPNQGTKSYLTNGQIRFPETATHLTIDGVFDGLPSDLKKEKWIEQLFNFCLMPETVMKFLRL